MKYKNGEDVDAHKNSPVDSSRISYHRRCRGRPRKEQRNAPNIAMQRTMIGIVGSGVLMISSGGDIGPPGLGDLPLPPGDPLPPGESILFFPPGDKGFPSHLLLNLGGLAPCAPNEILPGTPLPTPLSARCFDAHLPPAPNVGVFCPSASSSSLSTALSLGPSLVPSRLRKGEEGRAIRSGACGRLRAGGGTLSAESSLLRERIPPRRPVRAPMLREGVRRLNEIGVEEVEAVGSSGRRGSSGRSGGG